MTETNTLQLLTTLVNILNTLVNDVPKAIEVVDIVLPAIKAGRNLTPDEWTKLNSLADEAYNETQSKAS